jgi:hypothetical protein
MIMKFRPVKIVSIALVVAILVTLALTMTAVPVSAATKTFTGPGNFSDASKWGGSVPVAGDTLRINGTCTFDDAAANLAYGPLAVGYSSTGSIVWPGGGTNTLNVNGITSTQSGSSIDMINGGTLQTRGTWSMTNLTFTPGTGTVIFAPTATTYLPSTLTTFNNLTISNTGGTVYLGVATAVNGNLSITGTLSTGTGGTYYNLNVGGNWNKAGTFTANTATVTFNGTGDQSIGGTSTTAFGTLIINKTGTATLGVNITTSSNLTVTSGTLDLGTYTANRTASGGTLTVSNGATLKIGGTNSMPANYSTHTFGATSTIEYGGANQIVSSENYAGHLTLSGSGTKTLQAGTTTIGGNLTLSGTAQTATETGLIVGGNLDIGSGTTFTANDDTLHVTGTTSLTGTLDFSGSNTTTKTFTGDTTINSGGQWNENVDPPIVFGGSLDNQGDFYANNSVHTFIGAGETLNGTIAIPNVTINSPGAYTNNGTLTVSTALSGSGSLTNAGTLNLGGTSGITTLATSGSNTVNYNGSTQTVKGIVYNNLTLSGSNNKTIPSGTSVGGSLYISGTAKASITADQNIPANSLTLGSTYETDGTWGSTSATNADHWNNTYFAATTGYLTVATGSTPDFATYSDAGHSSPATEFDATNHIIYAYGTGLDANSTYTVKFLDNGNTVIDTTSVGTNGSSSFNNVVQYELLGSSGIAGTWHVQLFNGANPDSSLAITVQENAIPEFPTVIAGILVLGACGGIYYWMRRRKATSYK